MKVHSVLGRGFLEVIYQNALCIELANAGIDFEVIPNTVENRHLPKSENRRKSRNAPIRIVQSSTEFGMSPSISVFYEGNIVGQFSGDLLAEKTLLIENKAVSALIKSHEVQLVNYLTATKLDEGLLLNFGAAGLEFKKSSAFIAHPNRSAIHPRSPNSVNSVQISAAWWAFRPRMISGRFRCAGCARGRRQCSGKMRGGFRGFGNHLWRPVVI